MAAFVADFIPAATYSKHRDARNVQERILKANLKKAGSTLFGKHHKLGRITDPRAFAEVVPLRDYEQLRPYIERILKGEEDILWPGKPLYLAKTSGTTSGEKYIPISHDSIGHHIEAARNTLLFYIHYSSNKSFADGKMIFLQGSPVLEQKAGIRTGRLSGIVYHHVPSYLHRNRMPGYEANCIEDWETKVDAIVRETLSVDMRLISGIPPWMVMYFEKLLKASGKNDIRSIFPNFSLMIYGGVNYAPYRLKIEKLCGASIDSMETYPASEGFIAYQDIPGEKGLLLNIDAGMYFEFIPMNEFGRADARRLPLWEVEVGVNYALAITSNAGLWAYLIGDTVKFLSLDPYRIIVSGRTAQFISAFGEHVIMEEVESALEEMIRELKLQVNDFHVAPQINPIQGLPYHEWFIEFADPPENLSRIADLLDKLMQKKNTYYRDLIAGHVIQALKIMPIRKEGFSAYLRSAGKLGGQNKIPHLRNDRQVADALGSYLI